MPAAGHAEKSGQLHQHAAAAAVARQGGRSAGRCAQRDLVHLPPRPAAEGEGREMTAPPTNAGLNALTWDLPHRRARARTRAEEVLQEINGWNVRRQTLVPAFAELKNDGSTACGCWIYSGVFPETRRESGQPARAERRAWAWLGIRLARRPSHPLQPRLRAARRRAMERSERSSCGGTRKNASGPAWTSRLHEDQAAGLQADRQQGQADEALDGDKPFILHPDGLGWLCVPSGLKDGPLPAHYEPLGIAGQNPLYPEQQTNPAG